MKIVRRITVAIRTEERLLVRRGADVPESWCEECRSVVQWLAPEQAAAMVPVDSSVLRGWAESGLLHCDAITGGPVLICLNSLLCQIREYASKKEKKP